MSFLDRLLFFGGGCFLLAAISILGAWLFTEPALQPYTYGLGAALALAAIVISIIKNKDDLKTFIGGLLFPLFFAFLLSTAVFWGFGRVALDFFHLYSSITVTVICGMLFFATVSVAFIFLLVTLNFIFDFIFESQDKKASRLKIVADFSESSLVLFFCLLILGTALYCIITFLC